MNIFYDDLFCKERIDDIEFFEQCGFAIQKEFTIKEMSVDETFNNLYMLLDDYKHASFKFINFPDELTEFSKNGHKFYCFGYGYGYFLLNEQGNVYVLMDKYSSQDLTDEFCFLNNDDANLDKNLINNYQDFLKDKIHIQYANKNLLDFVNSYCYFLSAIYILKGNFKAYNQSLKSIAEKEAGFLEERLYNIDKNIINDYVYWGNMINIIRGVNIPLSSYFSPYKLTGRMPIY